jgi:cold shock CspA family protein/ribosome-associated translation inhibitor RaiA
MQQPLQITFRDVPRSDALEADIRDKAAKLDQFYERIMACRIMVEAPHSHHHQGNLYHIRIDLTVPRGELVVNRSPKDNHAHEDPYVAVRDAFNAARRQLQNYAKKQRGKVKNHETPPHGIINEIIPMQDFGRIQGSDGREIFFHRNSVIDGDFDSLEIGDEVWFSEESGEDGPQASTVHIVGKHHPVG